jgi:hypothetical protein
VTDVVYFAERAGLVKIGTTGDITTRLAQLDQGVSAVRGMDLTPVTLLATMPGSRPVERAVHEMFANLRYRGEWFLLAPPLIGFIEAVAAAEAYALSARGRPSNPWRYVRDNIVPRPFRLPEVVPVDTSASVLTLRQAVEWGVLPWGLEATKKRLQRARSAGRPVPVAAHREGMTDLYRFGDLIAWAESELTS